MCTPRKEPFFGCENRTKKKKNVQELRPVSLPAVPSHSFKARVPPKQKKVDFPKNSYLE